MQTGAEIVKNIRIVCRVIDNSVSIIITGSAVGAIDTGLACGLTG